MRRDRDEWRPELVLAFDLRIDALERREVSIDAAVRFGAFHEEEDDIRDLAFELDEDRGDGILRGIFLGRFRAFVDAARVEHRDRAAFGGVVEPLAAPGLRLDVTYLGDLCPEEGVDQRRLAGAATTNQRERWSSLFEKDRPEKGD